MAVDCHADQDEPGAAIALIAKADSERRLYENNILNDGVERKKKLEELCCTPAPKCVIGSLPLYTNVRL